jgi:hypothetical protein
MCAVVSGLLLPLDKSSRKQYIYEVDNDIGIEIIPSALKHPGISEQDIRTAIEQFVYDETMDDDPAKTLLLGFDGKARLLEVIYNILDESTIRIFHAMKCRPQYRALVGL